MYEIEGEKLGVKGEKLGVKGEKLGVKGEKLGTVFFEEPRSCGKLL